MFDRINKIDRISFPPSGRGQEKPQPLRGEFNFIRIVTLFADWLGSELSVTGHGLFRILRLSLPGRAENQNPADPVNPV
jgi:hypothetical protein